MTPGDRTIWIAVATVAVGTFALRATIPLLLDRVGSIPDPVETALGFVPAAVLAALVLPAVVVPDGSLVALGDGRLAAAAVAAVVAWRTENILATMATGVVVLMVIQQLL